MPQDGDASSGAPAPPASPLSGELLWRGKDPWGLLLAGLRLPLLQLFGQHTGISYGTTPWRLSPLWSLLLQWRGLFAPRSLRPGLSWDPLRPLRALSPGSWNPRHLLSTKEASVWVFRHWAFVVDSSRCMQVTQRGNLMGHSSWCVPPTSHKELFISLLLLRLGGVRKPKVKWALLFLKKVFQWVWPSLVCSHCSQVLNMMFSAVGQSIKVWSQCTSILVY